MRTIKELLEILLNNQEPFNNGLCSWVFYLYHIDKINFEEHNILRKYIENNKPSIFSSFDCFKEQFSTSGYYWAPKHIEPRIKWIKKHIKRNS